MNAVWQRIEPCGQFKRQMQISLLLRAMAILSIVMHHCMEIEDCLSFLLKMFGLGAFTFLAGFHALPSIHLVGIHVFLMKKILRILLPCFFWGMAFKLLFPQFIIRPFGPITGSHLWYLPMIFICFILAVLIVRLGRTNKRWFVFAWGVLILSIFHNEIKEAVPLINMPCLRPVRECRVWFPLFLMGMVVYKFFGDKFYCSILSRRPLFVVAVIAKYSFSIYLLHQFIIDGLIVINRRFNFEIQLNYCERFICVFLISLAFAWMYAMLSRWIMERMPKWKNFVL